MKNRYKVILSNKNIYREVYLSPDLHQIVVGTALDADVRFRKELFFGAVRLQFLQSEGQWSVYCSDNLFFHAGDARKLISLRLLHGMEFKVCGQQRGNAIFSVSFLIDFDYEEKDYARKIDISGRTAVKIGSEADADVSLKDEYLDGDRIVLTWQKGQLVLSEIKSRYGVSVNGVRAQGGTVVQERDFFSVACFSFYYKEGCLYTSGSEKIQVRGLRETVERKPSTVFVYPKFQRNTRICYKVEQTEIEIRPPAALPVLQKKGMVFTILPALVMLAMTIILRGVIGGGGMFVVYSAVSMGMGILMTVAAKVQDSREYKQKLCQRQENYQDYLQEKQELIQASRVNELRVLRLTYIALEESLKDVEDFGRRLFEKSMEDPDFLEVYLGTGRVESVNQVKYDRQESADVQDALAALPERMAESYRFIEDAPVTVKLMDFCGVGVVGARRQLEALFQNMTLDLAIRHFYKDVKLVYILDREWAERFDWVRWLRNVENENLDVRNIICDEESRKLLLEYLYGILSEREQIFAGNKGGVFGEHYVVLVADSESVCRHPVSKYLECCRDYGFTFVFFEEYEEKIPRGCGQLIYLGEEGRGQVFEAKNKEKAVSFVWPRIRDSAAKRAARRLGAICVDEVTLEEQLTKSISMFELLGIISADDLDLGKRWGESKVYQDMTAPLGRKSGGESAVLDISDRIQGHGPHGLVAGTTGSGKSEVLQTYILSMATLFHPHDVSFVLIDFKGGGMANQFEALPHLAGSITNIDGREIGRSLLSIKAELVRRQELLSEAFVNHVNDYIKLYKAGKMKKPMPHLIMIVDEFAELKAEYPDFMKELISAARIGRTLGIHLILATQKPAGVVDAQIWSNSRFRLCLKVQTKEDSNEVLKTPLAAEIVEPGRAYFQVGNNEIFELIQSAYSGGAVPSGGNESEKVYSVYECSLWGKKTCKYTSKKTEEREGCTQLQALVEHIRYYCACRQISKISGICLPPLKTVISTDELNCAGADLCREITVSIGCYDDPEQQRQGEVVLELSRDNVYITGSGQTGKTVLLQTILYGLLRNYAPEQVNLYLIDCGSMMLQMFECSAHVGGVVLAGEEEKCRNLFMLLKRMIVWRKKRLAGRGVGSFSSYLEAGFQDMPMAAVIIDNMAAFREYFPEQSEEVGSLSREAQGVGIAFIITSAASNALNYRTQANFGRKLALNCNDSAEYSNLFGHCKLAPGENPGRGLFMLDKRVLEWQAAVYGGIIREGERNKKLAEYIAQRNKSCKGAAEKIPMVPGSLRLAEAMRQDACRFRTARMIPVGMDYSTVDYSMLNLKRAGALALLGENESRICFVRVFMHLLAVNIIFHNVEASVVDDGQKRLEEVNQYGFVRSYVWNITEGMAAVEDFCDEILMREDSNREADSPMKILLLQNSELFYRICADQNAGRKLSKAVRRAKDQNFFLLFAQVENQPVGFQSSEVLKTLKEERQGILFAPVMENKFYEVSGRIKPEVLPDKSTGYRFDNGFCGKIKIFELEE